MKNTAYKILIISFISLISFSCTTTEIPLEAEPEPIIELVTYTKDVKTIIDSNCVVCHVTGGQASFLPLTNYSQVKSSAESGNLIARMNNATAPMPQSGILPAQTRAIVDKWKEDGFLEN